MSVIMEGFTKWLLEELNKRGWSRSEAARRGGVSASMFDKVINGHAKPGVDFCRGIARAFKEPPEFVFRKAGLLPNVPDDDATMRELVDLVCHLSPEDRQDVLEYALWRYRREQERREREANEN